MLQASSKARPGELIHVVIKLFFGQPPGQLSSQELREIKSCTQCRWILYIIHPQSTMPLAFGAMVQNLDAHCTPTNDMWMQIYVFITKTPGVWRDHHHMVKRCQNNGQRWVWSNIREEGNSKKQLNICLIHICIYQCLHLYLLRGMRCQNPTGWFGRPRYSTNCCLLWTWELGVYTCQQIKCLFAYLAVFIYVCM